MLPRHPTSRHACTGVACLLAALLAGCGSDPARDVSAYRALLDDNVRPPPATASSTLSLTDAMAIANARNESLAIDGEGYLRAVLEKRRSVSLFWPTVDLAPRWVVQERAGGDGYTADLDVPVDAELVVFDGLQNVNRYWRDVYLVERRRDLLLEAQEALLFDVAAVFYTVLRAEAQVRVLEQSLQVQGERLRDTRARQQVGTARPLDVAQSEALFAATSVGLIDARRQVLSARSLLGLLLASPVEPLSLLDDLDLPAQPRPAAELLDLAARHRCELSAARRAIDAAERQVRVSIGRYYPEVAIDVSAFLYRQSVPDARSWEAALRLNLPLFDAGRIDADVRTAWSFLREAMLVETQTRRRIERDLNQTLADIRASAARLEQLRVQFAAATEAFRQADTSYQVGLATNLERVTAQEAMIRAELALVTETFDGKLLQVALLRQTGTLRETLLEAPTTFPASTRPTAARTGRSVNE